MKLIEKTVMEKVAIKVMVLKLNFGARLDEREKGLQQGNMTLKTSSTVLLTDSMVSSGVAKGLEQIAGTQTRECEQPDCFLQLRSTCTSTSSRMEPNPRFLILTSLLSAPVKLPGKVPRDAARLYHSRKFS